MNYFEEYTRRLVLLGKGEKTKINVHFIISEPLTSFCSNINQKIREHNAGSIKMGIESIIVPHVSLFMGYVDSYKMLEDIFYAVGTYAQKLSPFLFEPTRMYFKGVSPLAPQYLFIDSAQSDFLMKQKEETDKILGDITYPNDWNIKMEKPHVTVGCYDSITQSIYDVVGSYNTIPSCSISQLGVSLSGKRGVCLSSLKVFDLSK